MHTVRTAVVPEVSPSPLVALCAPRRTPQPDDRRVLVTARLFEFGEPLLAGLDRGRGVNHAERFGDLAPVCVSSARSLSTG